MLSGNFRPDIREEPEGVPVGGGSGWPVADPHKGSQRGRILCADPAAVLEKRLGGRIMTEKEYLYLLLHAAGTEAVTAQRLYEHFGSYEHIWKAEKRELERSGL